MALSPVFVSLLCLPSFLVIAVKNWEKAVTEDAEVSSGKSVKKGFAEYVAKALNIEQKEDTARKQKLAKVPSRFSLKYLIENLKREFTAMCWEFLKLMLRYVSPNLLVIHDQIYWLFIIPC